jgi:predicted enzyme related to lactoylglutathione lyase
MAEFSSHAPGTFSWAELATTDQKAGVEFYRSLFDWNVNEQPISDAEVYTMFTLRGKEVAAAYTMRPEERQHGAPPHWNLYVTVANVDESVKKAESLGATVLAPPFEVMDVGRMAVLQDPTGAVFQVWEARKHIGAKILNEQSSLVWSELTTRDTKRAESFYTSLFGWTPKHAAPSGVMDYTEFHNQGKPLGGMMAMPHNMPPHVPSYWMPYFQVADVDASTNSAKGLGGKSMVGPQDIPNTGRFAILTDPQGAFFALYTPAKK